jgi:hypothetical protein
VWREDILAHAYVLSHANGGVPGVDGGPIYRSDEADTLGAAEAIVQAHMDAHPELMTIDPKERQAAHA